MRSALVRALRYKRDAVGACVTLVSRCRSDTMGAITAVGFAFNYGIDVVNGPWFQFLRLVAAVNTPSTAPLRSSRPGLSELGASGRPWMEGGNDER